MEAAKTIRYFKILCYIYIYKNKNKIFCGFPMLFPKNLIDIVFWAQLRNQTFNNVV